MNSLFVCWLEFFWFVNGDYYCIFVNWGVNGIDGIFFIVMGIVYWSWGEIVLLIGDLFLLYDSNGFLN